jgi:hypothetical protein
MKLVIFSIILASFRFCWLHRIQFYFVALPAVSILAILTTLVTTLFPQDSQQAFGFKFLGESIINSKEVLSYSYDGLSWRSLAEFFLFILMVAFFPLYSVAWHRFFLVPKERIKIWHCYVWQRRHSLFLWLNIKIFLLIILIGGLAFLVTLASALFAPIVGVIMIIFVTVCYARFSMWLPAAALDKKMTLRESLFLTRENGGRLAAILILTGIVAGILDGIATSLISYASVSLGIIGALTQSLLTNFALYLIMYAGMAVGITALSIGYQKLSEDMALLRQNHESCDLNGN